MNRPPVRRPLDTPKDATLLDRYYMVGLACMVVLVLSFPVYKWTEPARRANAFAAMHEENLHLGEELYALHCAACHGDDGRGGRGFPTLAAREFLGSVSDRQLRYLVAGGIPGTAMSPYDMDLGGPFTAQEIERLITYLRDLETGAPSVPGWRDGALAPPRTKTAESEASDAEERTASAGTDADDREAERAAATAASPAPGASPTPTTVVAAAPPAEYTLRCAACHGAMGDGTPIAPAVRASASVMNETPDALFAIVSRGVPGTAMQAFGQAHGGPLDEATIRALVAWMRGTASAP